MDAIVHGSMSLETETKCFHLSPKRAKRDDTVTNSNTSTCDLPDFLTLQTLGAPPLASPQDSDLICLEQNGHILDKKPCAQIQNTPVSVGPQAEGTISNALEICVIGEECPFLHLKIYDQLDKLSPSPLLGSCTLKDSTADMSTHHQHQLLDKSLEDKPTDCSLPCENESSNDGEVRVQSYFSCHSNRHDTVPRTCSQSVAFDESNQKEESFTDTIFQQGVRRDEGEKFPSLIKEFQLFVPPPDKGIPVMLAQDKSKVDMCDSHAVCDRETNDRANDNGTSNTVSPVECTEVLLISYHASQAMYISAETESTDNFGWANGEHDETVAETQRERVHHTPENHMSAGISIEAAEGDNDADLRRVMEPALWGKTVRAAEENSFNSESVAGEELPPSVIDCELQISLHPASDARPSQPTSDGSVPSPNQSRAQQHEDKKEKLSESFSVPSFGMHNTSGYEGSCHLTSRPSISPQRTAKPPAAGDGRQQSGVIAGHRLEERSSCLPVSRDDLKARHVQHSLPGAGTRDERKEIKVMTGEIKSDELALQQHSPSNVDISEQTLEGGFTEGSQLTPGEAALHDITQCQQTVEMLEHKVELLTSLSDAIKSGPRELSHRLLSQNTDRVMAQKWQDRFSAFAMCTHVPAGFDNFHKIRLSPDDDDDDAVQGNGCPHASLALQLMKSPQMERPMLEAEGKHAERPKGIEEDQGQAAGGRVECHVEDFANGDFNTDSNCTQGLSGEDMIASEFSTDAGNKRPLTHDPVQCLEFKMKNEFDLVLKELNVYFDVCKSEIACDNGTSPEQCEDVLCSEVSESKCHKCHSSSELALRRDSTLGLDEGRSIEICVRDPEACCITRRGGEQEVPIAYHMSKEASSQATENHKETHQTELKRTAWTPSFMGLPLTQQQSHARSWEAKRLEPLRTCTRPIRLGLSKRAKPKSLHRFHPCK